ncbi:MAG: acyl-ACP--UDP-N-acetylglucosamine O-acyltransferase [Pirellulaceae bacterium]|nr:acyl-ACP--UDP-N-acetylglucosamine O-acyltransferase [Pirellulaceae bacterium]
MTRVHETAVVSPDARLGENVSIGAFSVIEAGTTLDDDCQIASHVVIKSGTSLGVNCEVAEGAVLGGRPQHLQAGNEVGRVDIGDHNVIREYVTIHRALEPASVTQIGQHNLLMANSHVGHDCDLGDHIIVANNVMIAGHVVVDDCVYIAGAAGIHQFCRTGQYAMVGGQAHVAQDVPPFVMLDGITTKIVGLNQVGLRRSGFSPADLSDLKAAYRVVYREGLTWNETLAKLGSQFPDGPASEFYEFLVSSQRGVVQERRTPRAATVRFPTNRIQRAVDLETRKAG